MNLYTRDFIYTLKQNEEIEIDLNTFVDQVRTSKDYALLVNLLKIISLMIIRELEMKLYYTVRRKILEG